ncbi:MAG: succinylglutamate desuccinylase/aspartoacylase family protein [Myxococcales bacterium]|nr:succinylglutamate desuccinylase/aspartoacylase family protein [Myxococcales bacterium]
MLFKKRLVGDYPSAARFQAGWRTLAHHLNGEESIAGHSVEGRPIYRFDLGTKGAPVVMLSALIHGIEVIGSVALYQVLRDLGASDAGKKLFDELHLVVLPILNPDAFTRNMNHLDRGWPALRRTNARGVDLNRNFPHVAPLEKRHLFSGSTWKGSPHYQGPKPFSEPESRAVRNVVETLEPHLSLGFHSFGNMILYPWAFSQQPNRRYAVYSDLANAFAADIQGARYAVRQASQFYPTVGDMDDWLDDQHGTLAMTIEVGALNRRLFHPLRLLNPFCWMNPLRIETTVGHLVPGMRALLDRAAHMKLPALTPA